MKANSHIHILGAGIAGLSVGYFARKNGFPITIYEAADRIGGNSMTIRYGEYLFDTGAHRFHDKNKQITAMVKTLLGEDLKRINVPSRIFSRNHFIDFPISPLNLLKNIGLFEFSKAFLEIMTARFQKRNTHDSFESYALNTYGQTIAGHFLLNYSEKLWGKESRRLSPSIAGNRLKGLDIRTFILEAFSGSKSKTEHLDGAFLYPRKGIGMITDKLAHTCGQHNIRTQTSITKIFHKHEHINAIEVNDREIIEVDQVVNTLPVSLFLQIMEPRPSHEILKIAQSLSYRNIVLVALVINRKAVMDVASLYFPETDVPFTRVYEPKNRSSHMAPEDTTLLVAEIPCQKEDVVWNFADQHLIDLVGDNLCGIGVIYERDILDATVYRLVNAYPVLEVGIEDKLAALNAYFQNIKNLTHSGRNGCFQYIHIHELMRSGKRIVDYLKQSILQADSLA